MNKGGNDVTAANSGKAEGEGKANCANLLFPRSCGEGRVHEVGHLPHISTFVCYAPTRKRF